MYKSKRAEVIENAVVLEDMVSTYLCYLFDVPKSESRLFGETSKSLPFNNKLDLLLELNFFDKETKEKFSLFGEIRNKFAHLKSVSDFSGCFARLNGSENRLLKFYPIEKLKFTNEESYFTRLYCMLYGDLIGSVDLLIKKIWKDADRNAEITVELRMYKYHAQLLAKLAEKDSHLSKILPMIHKQVLNLMKTEPEQIKSRFFADIAKKSNRKD